MFILSFSCHINIANTNYYSFSVSGDKQNFLPQFKSLLSYFTWNHLMLTSEMLIALKTF